MTFAQVLCGFCNGVLISSTKVVPFIVTLGTMTIYLGRWPDHCQRVIRQRSARGIS